MGKQLLRDHDKILRLVTEPYIKVFKRKISINFVIELISSKNYVFFAIKFILIVYFIGLIFRARDFVV